ncbi:MAG: hypothetical protein AB7N76_28705 [Planctomycetota bacterium]
MQDSDASRPGAGEASRARPRAAGALGCALAGLALGGVAASGAYLSAKQVVAGKDAEQRAVLEALAAEGLGADDAELFGAPSPAADLQSLRVAFSLVQGLSLDCKSALELHRGEAEDPPTGTWRPDARQRQMLTDPEQWRQGTRDALQALVPLDAALDPVLAGGHPIHFDLDRSRGLSLDLSHVMQIRELVQVLCGRALQRARSGQAEAGWLDLTRAVELLSRWDEPYLLSYFLRVASFDHVADALQRLLRRAPPGAALAARLEQALSATEQPDELARVFRAELSIAIASFPTDAQAPMQTMEQLLVPGDPALVAYRLPLWGRVAYAGARLDYVELMAEAVRAARLPAQQARRALEALSARAQQGERGPLAENLVPALNHGLARSLFHRGRLRLLRTALRLATDAGAGDLPDELPDPLLGDPTALGAAPLRWARSAPRRGRLWCVGDDGLDDGGLTPAELTARGGAAGAAPPLVTGTALQRGDIVIEVQLAPASPPR